MRFENWVEQESYCNADEDLASESYAGRLYLSAYGYVDATTPAPLQYSLCPLEYADTGGPVVIAGANGSQSRLKPESPERVRIEVDSNGDAVFESSIVYAWADLDGAVVP